MSSSQTLNHSPLGRATQYISHYDSSLLCPVPRVNNWEGLGYEQVPFRGCDIWNAYEISWLNLKGLPRVAMAEFRVPCDSSHLVESKSFKLYLNSFNQTRFESADEVVRRMERDLSKCAGAPVSMLLTNLNVGSEFVALEGRCLDDQDLLIEHYQPAPQLLGTLEGELVEEKLYSHLLKSNCPVTGQPDWASVQISYRGKPIDPEGLLHYIVSYREHWDFHEQCIEQMFLDILTRCRPESLTVFARYVRRGGLDINPYRSTESIIPVNGRLGRQ